MDEALLPICQGITKKESLVEQYEGEIEPHHHPDNSRQNQRNTHIKQNFNHRKGQERTKPPQGPQDCGADKAEKPDL